METTLKPNRKAVFEYVRDCPYSPTRREIGEMVLLSPSTVQGHLEALERDGLIKTKGSRVYVPKDTP